MARTSALDTRSLGRASEGGLGGKVLITAGPGACGAPHGVGRGPDSPPWEAQGTVLCALSPRPARRLLGRRDPLGPSLHIPAGGSAVGVGDFHIHVQHHMAGRRVGLGWRGSSQRCGPLHSALRALTRREASPHVLKGAQLLPWTELGPGKLRGAEHWWCIVYQAASLSTAWPSEVKQDSSRPPP